MAFSPAYRYQNRPFATPTTKRPLSMTTTIR
jgi:hypothetical protein